MILIDDKQDIPVQTSDGDGGFLMVGKIIVIGDGKWGYQQLEKHQELNLEDLLQITVKVKELNKE